MNRLFYKDFDSTGAINQMIKTDPHLKWSLDQAKRGSLFKALGLVVRNTSLDLPHIVATTLTPFCRYGPVFASRGEDVKAAVSLGPPSSQSTSTPPEYQPPSDFQGDTEQTDEEDIRAAVSLGPPSSQSTSTPPEYQPPSDFQGDTEQTDEEDVRAAVSLGPPSSQSTSTPPEYQPPSDFQGDTEQTDEEDVRAAVSLGPPSSQSTSTPPEYQPPSDFQGNTEQTDEEHVYTSALKELGDSEYCLPTYILTRLCHSPPRWEAVAQYKGVRSSAEASSKRAAKHSASKALWLQLGNSTLL
ncbi:hypothetical protein N7449_008245 [Penicillium cf. viridicatum]|uniref:DRBM domain-containing protein n=1 Tax=Penicillium cf. viridicatum TaxID=2972119 RepID=A0A9W9J7Q9_9EURO|nr:hypothetical protein N7449_008245 [Penicillium cf. viridicatum]